MGDVRDVQYTRISSNLLIDYICDVQQVMCVRLMSTFLHLHIPASACASACKPSLTIAL